MTRRPVPVLLAALALAGFVRLEVPFTLPSSPTVTR